MFLAFLIYARPIFSLKGKDIFSFWGSARKDIRAVWRGFNTDSVLRKLFSGDMDFRKTSANFQPAERGLGNECGRASLSDFFGG